MAIAATNNVDRPVLRSALHEGFVELEECSLIELDSIRQALQIALDPRPSSEPPLAWRTRQSDRVSARVFAAEQRYGDLQQRILCLLARQAPVASDLRLVLALLQVNYRIKRMRTQIIDLVSQRCAIPNTGQPVVEQLDCLATMAKLVEDQIAAAGRAFSDRDVDGDRRLRRDDGEINRRNRRCFSLAVEHHGNEADREAAFCVVLMARALERIGDNAVDIAAQGRFVAHGDVREIPAPA